MRIAGTRLVAMFASRPQASIMLLKMSITFAGRVPVVASKVFNTVRLLSVRDYHCTRSLTFRPQTAQQCGYAQ